MPRTVKEIMDQADELARRFEAGEIPAGAGPLDARSLREVREAFEDVANAQKRLGERVTVARAEGQSWAMIGMMVGTSGEAARQRYSQELAQSAPAAAKPKAQPSEKAAARVPAKKAAPARKAAPAGGTKAQQQRAS